MTDKYDVEINDLTVECQTIEDGFEKAIARYEFPYRDGALLEDMGQKARVIRIRCYFYGPTYEDHKALLNSLISQDLTELFHPKYGLIEGKIETVSVRHDDRYETAEIDLTFVENFRGVVAADLAGIPGVDSLVEEDFEDLQDDQMDALEYDILQDGGAAVGWDGPDFSNAVAQDLVPSGSIISQIVAVSRKGRQYMKQIDSFEKNMLSKFTAVTNPATSILETINYGARLPGRLISTFARTVERQARMLDSLRTAPYRFLKSLSNSFKMLESSVGHVASNLNSFGGRKIAETAQNTCATALKIACAGRMGVEAAYLYYNDQASRQAQKAWELGHSFDARGRYVKSAQTAQVMSMNELESSLADVRGYIQDAIDQSRGLDSLKKMAADLLDHVNTIKLQRERIYPVLMDNELPLHLVCLKYGLPYNAAERIYQINDIPKPNFTSGQINIYTV